MLNCDGVVAEGGTKSVCGGALRDHTGAYMCFHIEFRRFVQS